MKVQTLYIITGLVWGLVLSPDAGLYAAGKMGSVVWLYEYREGAWASWVIVPFGVTIGLMVLFSSYQLGAAVGRRYDDFSEMRLRHAKSVPWALVVLGVGVGAITAVTIEDRQRAVVDYVQNQRVAVGRLQELVENVHRVSGYDVDWPGGGENGRIEVSFLGKRTGEYLLTWRIFSAEGKEPLLDGDYEIRLGKEHLRASIPVNATDLVNAFIIQANKPGAQIEVDERFRLEMDLIPVLNSRQWAKLPEGEAERLEEGDSFLIKRTEARFNVQFQLQGQRVFW